MGSGSAIDHQHHQVATTLHDTAGAGPGGAGPFDPGDGSATGNGAPSSDSGGQPAGPRQLPRAVNVSRELAGYTTTADRWQRIVMQPVTSTAVAELGYDRGRLEVAFQSGQQVAYQHVPYELWARLNDPQESIGRIIATEVRGNPAYAYPDGDAAGRDRHYHRCPYCGQFANDSHVCPATTAVRTYLGEHVSLSGPNATAVQEFLGDHDWASVPVTATVQDPLTGTRHAVDGEVVLHRDESGVRPLAYPNCDCGAAGSATDAVDGRCLHSAMAAAEVVDRVTSPRIRTPERRAAQAVLAQIGLEHTASIGAQDQAVASWTGEETTSYRDDPAAFQAAYDAARARRDSGEPAVPYLTENATGGLGARDGGRGFGVELEFDLPNDMPYSDRTGAVQAIGADLHAAGLSQQAHMVGYHQGRGSRGTDAYSDAPNGWRLEQDGTVDGEIVSPILYDEPHTWRNLATVCDIVRRHGGRASVRTGGHVHVSAGNYDHTVENHTRLLGLVAEHEDTLFRLAQNPAAERHRGTSWCEPNVHHPDGYRSVPDVRYAHAGHHLALNLQSMQGGRSDHVEFRMWDGSLDPGVVQAQIKLSLGLTEAAFRTARGTSAGGVFAGEREPVGTHRRRRAEAGASRRRLRGEDWRADTESFRGLLDTVFSRAQDKAQATALFAVTRWQSRR